MLLPTNCFKLVIVEATWQIEMLLAVPTKSPLASQVNQVPSVWETETSTHYSYLANIHIANTFFNGSLITQEYVQDTSILDVL